MRDPRRGRPRGGDGPDVGAGDRADKAEGSEAGTDRDLRASRRREARSEEVGVICVSNTGNQYAVIYTRYDLRWLAA